MEKKEDILLGSGEIYMHEFNDTVIPEDAIIETELNNVGHCNSGFSIDYKPDIYDVKNQHGKTVKRYTIGESITAKTGIISWSLKKLSLLSTAEFLYDSVKKVKKLIFGGNKALKTVLLRFVHTKENGKKLRFTMIAQGGNGFALDFAQKELTIDAELTAIDKKTGWLAEFEEELTDAEIAELNSVILSAGSLGIAGDSKVVGLTTGKIYKVTTGTIVKYTKADGTLTTLQSKAAITGTEITGLLNGTSYLVEEAV
ncbi:MAG: hypothetical protein RR945_02775 [Erysipelotrichaceae bacterium]